MSISVFGVYTHMSAGPSDVWNRALNPVKLESQVVVGCLTWVLGTECRFSARVV